jgi:hypothetical protein
MTSIPSLRSVSIHIEDAIALIKYNRPQVGNALSQSIMEVNIHANPSTGKMQHINKS